MNRANVEETTFIGAIGADSSTERLVIWFFSFSGFLSSELLRGVSPSQAYANEGHYQPKQITLTDHRT